MVTMLQAFVLGSLRLRPIAIVSFPDDLCGTLPRLLARRLDQRPHGVGHDDWLHLSACHPRGSCAAASRFLPCNRHVTILAVILVILLSIPATRELFLDRFTLVKDYDAGETGRFGNQLNAIPKLMQLPFGFGPYQFGAIYDLAPHNTFLNSFSSGGWIGGFAFMLFVISSIVVGFRTMFIRTPFQPYTIPVFSCFVAVTFQGIQIDTEHWRHLYWMTGLVWGFFAASLAYSAAAQRFVRHRRRLESLPARGTPSDERPEHKRTNSPTLPAAFAINGISRDDAVWLMFAAYVEPAPVDVVFIAVLLGFAICRIIRHPADAGNMGGVAIQPRRAPLLGSGSAVIRPHCWPPSRWPGKNSAGTSYLMLVAFANMLHATEYGSTSAISSICSRAARFRPCSALAFPPMSCASGR
jgi:hypothetical protein